MLTLFWENPNTVNYERTDIYRALTKEGPYVLIGSVPPYTMEFTDPLLPKINTVYWYRVVFVDDFMEDAVSVDVPLGYFPTGTGPGPQEIKRGNWELGFFGEVHFSQLPSYEAIREGFPTMTQPPGTTPNVWYKCVAQGNIIFIPDCSVITPYTYMSAHGTFVPPIDGPTDIINELEHDGYFFSARPPYLSKNRRNKKAGFESEDLLTDIEATRWSEMAAVCSVFVESSPESLGGIRKVNGAVSPTSAIPLLSSTPSNQSNYSRWTINQLPASQISTADTGSVFVFLILEMLF